MLLIFGVPDLLICLTCLKSYDECSFVNTSHTYLKVNHPDANTSNLVKVSNKSLRILFNGKILGFWGSTFRVGLYSHTSTTIYTYMFKLAVIILGTLYTYVPRFSVNVLSTGLKY